uniref:Sodium-and chloride-dependent glycine transporter 2 n=1 Tax=Syphacia muris TaxID=451379 RepID=A0A0N5AXQ4_9BILA
METIQFIFVFTQCSSKYYLGLHYSGASNSSVSASLSDPGPINWERALCLLIVYIVCYFSLWKGIKMSGKVVWFTAIFPYVVLSVLFVRGITLPGAEKGIDYYLRPNITMLQEASVWQDAATQILKLKKLLLLQQRLCNTSLQVLGYMACKSGKPIQDVAQEGPGLVFVVYPEALATMPGASLWSIIFFLMLLTLGLDSSFGGTEAIITALSDEFPSIKNRREVFIAVLFVFYMLIGLTMCTNAGMLVMEWLIVYGTNWGLLVAVFCETIVIALFYGIKQFANDLKKMLGFFPGWYWKLCWTVISPIFLLGIIASTFVNYGPLQYQDYTFSFSSNLIGLIFAISAPSAIPIAAVYKYFTAEGKTFKEVAKFLENKVTPTL